MKPARKNLPDRYLTFGLASRRVRPTLFDQFHRHNEMELLAVESGSLTYLISQQRLEFNAGTLAVFWGAVPHKLIAVRRGLVNWVTVPLPWMLQWKLPFGLPETLLQGGVVFETGSPRFASDLAQFRLWHMDLTSGNAERRRTVVLEVEARLRRMAIEHRGSRPRRNGASKTSGAENRIDRLASYIAERYADPLTTTEIAAAAGLNADYATSLFRKTTGMTLVDYVTHHRISHAQRLLMTTDRKVLDIALDAGFGSLSRFYEAFVRACGQTPRAFRMSARAE